MARVAEPRAAGTLASRLLFRLGLLVPTFAEIEEHRPLGAPLTLVGVLSVAAAFSVQPLLAEAASGEAVRGLSLLVWATAILSPAFAGAKGLVLAVLAWSVLVLLGRAVRLRLLASLFLYGEAVGVLHGVAIVAVLHLRGPGAVSSPEDLYVPMGLECLVPAGARLLEAAARGATLFHLAWFVFLAVGLDRAARLSPGLASSIAGGAWLLSLAMGVLRAAAFP